jgi:hypothetical protein
LREKPGCRCFASTLKVSERTPYNVPTPGGAVNATRCGSIIVKTPPSGQREETFSEDCNDANRGNVMDDTMETEEDFITVASNGLSRVAEAIIAVPSDARVGAINAVVESYRKTARDFLDEEATEKWLVNVVTRLEAEVNVKEEQQGKGSGAEAASLVPKLGS